MTKATMALTAALVTFEEYGQFLVVVEFHLNQVLMGLLA